MAEAHRPPFPPLPSQSGPPAVATPSAPPAGSHHPSGPLQPLPAQTFQPQSVPPALEPLHPPDEHPTLMKDELGKMRAEYESVDLDEMEISGIEELDSASVESLLAMTGESWSIDEQRETLKKAADNDAPRDKPPESIQLLATTGDRPSVKIPTAGDFGGTVEAPVLVLDEEPAKPSLPRPGAGKPAPLKPTARSVPPPPPPARGANTVPPPLTKTAPPHAPAGPASRRPPPIPTGQVSGQTTGSSKGAPVEREPPKTTPEGAALSENQDGRV